MDWFRIWRCLTFFYTISGTMAFISSSLRRGLRDTPELHDRSAAVGTVEFDRPPFQSQIQLKSRTSDYNVPLFFLSKKSKKKKDLVFAFHTSIPDPRRNHKRPNTQPNVFHSISFNIVCRCVLWPMKYDNDIHEWARSFPLLFPHIFFFWFKYCVRK